MFTVFATDNTFCSGTSYCECFIDFDSAKAAFDDLDVSRNGCVTMIDGNYNELFGKYVTACGDVHIRDCTT